MVFAFVWVGGWWLVAGWMDGWMSVLVVFIFCAPHVSMRACEDQTWRCPGLACGCGNHRSNTFPVPGIGGTSYAF